MSVRTSASFQCLWRKSCLRGARLLAFEPLPDNVDRLRENLRRSGIENVDVLPMAVAATEGVADLLRTDDTAFAGLAATIDAGRQGDVVRVPVGTIDRVWLGYGQPDVSVIKLDIEGGEYEALKGAMSLLRRCRPTVLVEAETSENLSRIESLLVPVGYKRTHPVGFKPWNHLFISVDKH